MVTVLSVAVGTTDERNFAGYAPVSSFSFCKRSSKTSDVTGVVCYYGDLPAVVRTGHKEASQCKVCGKLPGVKENLLALCGYGGRDDCGVYGGKSGKEETWKTV